MTSKGNLPFGPFIVNKFGDKYLYEVNRNAFDKVGSSALYQKHFGKELFAVNRLYLIAGTDSGVFLQFLRKKTLPEGTRYLFVELPEVIEALENMGVLRDLPERIRVVAPDDVWTQATEFRLQDYLFLDAVEPRDSFAATDANLTEYADLSDSLREQLQAIIWAVRANLGCRGFIVRQLENLGENRLPAIHLKGSFPGKTAVVLGGGPSLDEILPWVRDNSERVAIFAVSRVCRRLLEFGLAPHLIFSVDPHDVSFDVSREMLAFHDKSIFVHSYHVSPKLLGQWRGRSLYLGERYPWSTEGNPKNLLNIGPTVTNTAFSVAVEMGFSHIVLAGVDLCFSQSGMTHAAGSIENAIGPKLDNLLTVETNGGWRAETGADFFHAIETLGQQVAIAGRAGCQVVTPALGAAKIPGVTYVPLDEIVIQPSDRPIFPSLIEVLPQDGQGQWSEYYDQVLRELKSAKGEIEQIKALASEALYCNKRLFGRGGKKADFKFKIRMDKIEETLDQEYAGFSRLIKRFSIQRFLKITRLETEKDWSDDEIEKTADVYYSTYKDSASDLLKILEQATSRVKARKEEYSASPRISAFKEIWRRDGQPGRVLIWLARCPFPDQVSSTCQPFIAELKEEYESMVGNTDTLQAKQLRQLRGLGPVRSKALRLFKLRDRDGLLRIDKALEHHSDRKEAETLRALVAGYMAELEGNPSAAFEEYQKLIGDHFEPITEDALKRIASLGLETGEIEYAGLALECLAGAVFVYKPPYADLLRLLGQHQAAADLYVEYLERVPSDASVLIKLGQLYQSMGADEAAREVFRMVQELDPENEAMKVMLG